MDIKQNKSYFKWIWAAVTVVFCLLFTFALIPGVAAQSNSSSPAMSTRSYSNAIQSIFDHILRYYVEEVDSQALFEAAVNAMFDVLDDPYSAFLSISDMSDLSNTTQGNYGGVGLHISKPTYPRPDGRPLYVEVAAPIEDTPGWRAGLMPGDFIVEINDEPTDPMSMDDVLDRLKGVPGEQVKLLIKRGERMEFPVTLIKEIIEVPTVKHAMIGDTGYVRLLTFTPFTAERTIDAINEFKANNYKNLILDLRNNYGGRLDAAIDVADIFLDGGLVVRTRSRIASENRSFSARRSALVPDSIPIIILINGTSASASEIVAGALKDRGRAYLVGENTYGKGSVQQVISLSSTTGFRITTARYYTPSDANIDKVGIPPDLEVLFPTYTEEDAVKLNELINANKIPDFAKQNPQASNSQIEIFAAALNREYNLDMSLLKRLIRDELHRTEISPVFDLDYDVQLQEAIKIFESGNYQNLMLNAKTIKALQEEAENELAFAS